MPNWIIKNLIYFFICISIVLLVVIVTTVFKDHKICYGGTFDWKYAKQISDLVPIISISWSILGVLLIYMTFNVQKEQFAKTSAFISKQQFETTFFNMLNVLFNIKQSIKKEIINKEYSGQEFIEKALSDFKKAYLLDYSSSFKKKLFDDIISKIKVNIAITDVERDISKEETNNSYLKFYSLYHSELGHYFRYLFNLIKFTEKSRSSFKDEKEYIDLIQAQLSNSELSLIFYNALSDKGLSSGKIPLFYLRLEKYNFFENIDYNSLLLREHHVFYPKTNFKFLNVDEIKMKSV